MIYVLLLLLLQCIATVHGDGTVTFFVDYYHNPSSLTSANEKCDIGQEKCEYIFTFKTKIGDTPTHEDHHGTIWYHYVGDSINLEKVLKYNFKGAFPVNNWNLHIKVEDGDTTLFFPEYVDEKLMDSRNMPIGKTFKRHRINTSYGRYFNIRAGFNCKDGYVGSLCQYFCKPHSDATNGFYDCNELTGEKVCHHGFTPESQCKKTDQRYCNFKDNTDYCIRSETGYEEQITDCTGLVQEGWQSSSRESGCFSEQVCNKKLYNNENAFFQSKNSLPNPWLLLKLKSAYVIKSVTMTQRRINNFEYYPNYITVSLASSHLAFQHNEHNHCSSSLTTNANYLTQCSKPSTNKDEVGRNSDLIGYTKYRVYCCNGNGCGVAAQYILLKKTGNNRRYMTFSGMQIHASDVCDTNISFSSEDLIEDTAVTVTVKPLHNSCSNHKIDKCFVRSPFGLEIIEAQQSTSQLQYSITPTREMNDGNWSFCCSVIEDEKMKYERCMPLRNVYNKAKNPSFTFLTPVIIGRRVFFSVSHSVCEPAVTYEFKVTGKRVPFPPKFTFFRKETAKGTVTSYWSFKPLSESFKTYYVYYIRCYIKQTRNNRTISPDFFISDGFPVLSQAITTWNVSHNITVKEGDTISLQMKSGRGKPMPQHQCEIESTKTKLHRHEEIIRDSEKELQYFLLTFTATARKQHNMSALTCLVTQGLETALRKKFTAFITVI